MARLRTLVPTERIERSILFIRAQKVMLDSDLAELYGVETRVLIQAVKRNKSRFPKDFMFQLTKAEFAEFKRHLNQRNLRSQSVISRWGGRRYSPFAFTEQGVAMLSTVLNSQQAVAVNIEVMRAFVRLRQLLETHADLAYKIELLEKKYDRQFKVVFDAIRQLMIPPASRTRQIGYKREDR